MLLVIWDVVAGEGGIGKEERWGTIPMSRGSIQWGIANMVIAALMPIPVAVRSSKAYNAPRRPPLVGMRVSRESLLMESVCEDL